MESRDSIKKKSFKRFFSSFKHSFDGLYVAYRDEQSMLLHLVATIIVVTGGIYFGIDLLEWLIVAILIGLVLGAELINTAIEAVTDIASPDYHDLAKVAKDTASASVLVYSTVAMIGGIIIFGPRIFELFM